MNAIEQLCDQAILMSDGQLMTHSNDIRSGIHQYRIYGGENMDKNEWINKPQKNSSSIYFTIQEGSSNSSYWMSKRPSILAPLLEWKKYE